MAARTQRYRACHRVLEKPPYHWGRRSLREIAALSTNNAGNVDTVVNRRINIEEYRAGKVLKN